MISGFFLHILQYSLLRKEDTLILSLTHRHRCLTRQLRIQVTVIGERESLHLSSHTGHYRGSCSD